MADARLICAGCGTKPTELEAKYTAAPGKTHYRDLHHGFGIPGNRGGRKVRGCGPWVEASATKEQREQAMQVWRERPRG